MSKDAWENICASLGDYCQNFNNLHSNIAEIKFDRLNEDDVRVNVIPARQRQDRLFTRTLVMRFDETHRKVDTEVIISDTPTNVGALNSMQMHLRAKSKNSSPADNTTCPSGDSGAASPSMKFNYSQFAEFTQTRRPPGPGQTTSAATSMWRTFLSTPQQLPLMPAW